MENDPAEAIYDFEKNIVTFKFSKDLIGNQNPGDLLTQIYAWTALRLNKEPFTILISSGELANDAAPFLENIRITEAIIRSYIEKNII